LGEYVVGQVVRSQWVGFVTVVASKREEFCNHIVISLEVLQGKAMGAVKEDPGQVRCNFLDGFVSHRGWLDTA
jgi:hypothetical protein